MIAHNRQVAKMVKLKARTKADLLKVKGIGEAKVARYGEEILKLLAEHITSGPDDKKETEKESEK